jgi:hypothetical protein
MAHARDRPPLRESTEIITPSGKHYRWADDEHRAENVPSGERWSDVMPGGFETFDATLPRKPGTDYSDLERLSTLTRYDASGGIIWQGRLERAPRVSGDQIAISPSAVGYQAHLEDDKSVREIYIDRDLRTWGEAATQLQLWLASASREHFASSVTEDTFNASPGVKCQLLGPWTANSESTARYDAGAGNKVGAVWVSWERGANVNDAESNWHWAVYVTDDDGVVEGGAGTESSGSLRTESSQYFTPGTPRRFAGLRLAYAIAATGDGQYALWWKGVTVYGDHGLTLRGDDPGGFYDADIIRHAIGKWCPFLTITDESVTADPFIIPQSAFRDPTTVGEIVRQTTRFRLRHWAVWEGPTFWLHDWGARGTAWRARVGPSGLEETGPQVDRLWESVIVAYQDVDGTTRTVGPVGSGADTESADLKDDDPENPANKLGITRRDLLTMGVSTAAGATEIGARFLEQAKLLDSSGRARLVGHVQDDRGVWHPYSHVRAGDTISFVDASDTSYRRVVKTDKSRDERACTVDLDSPPEGLTALLERLGVVLTPLGL